MNKRRAEKFANGRALHLIDIENLVGSSEFTEGQVAGVRAEYLSLVKPGVMDQFYVASSRHNEVATAFGWPNCQRQFLTGEDAADYLIIKRAIDAAVAANFDHIYVGTGDHSLANYVTFLQGQGIKVTVVSMERCLSYDMRNSGAEVLQLVDLYQLAA